MGAKDGSDEGRATALCATDENRGVHAPSWVGVSVEQMLVRARKPQSSMRSSVADGRQDTVSLWPSRVRTGGRGADPHRIVSV